MTVGKVLFEEWAREDDATPHLLGGPSRGPCPLCGHPTGDCTTDHHVRMRAMADDSKKKSESKKSESDAPDTSAPANSTNEPGEAPKGTGAGDDGGRLPGTTTPVSDARAPREADEPRYLDAPHADAGEVSVTFENGSATLEQDVYEQVAVHRAETPTYRLVGRKGQTIREGA